ncbi:hypothetical protein [Microbacterium aurantiacum]|uniref:Uncharacterized protein n=1 Tax=Microbacterium aurantiacum TaxID=162393 RepID=A0AAJ2HIT6_9MICO|nr:hypothetical protein [Microbacterium aurantiacum]MDS0246976.1 hypothetical protein [Microbacterium aurantiacum]
MNTTDALRAFAATGTGDLTFDVAPSLSCQEADTLAALLRALGYTADAAREHPASDAERERWLELREEEPEAFGAGHIVLYAEDEHRFAITEQCDRPSDDPDRDVIGWEWQTAERAPSDAWMTTATGHAHTEHVRALLIAVIEWVRAVRD